MISPTNEAIKKFRKNTQNIIIQKLYIHLKEAENR